MQMTWITTEGWVVYTSEADTKTQALPRMWISTVKLSCASAVKNGTPRYKQKKRTHNQPSLHAPQKMKLLTGSSISQFRSTYDKEIIANKTS